MIITVGHLKLIHYYYFAMGIFCFSSVFFIGFDSPFSFVFLLLYAMNSGISWYVAHIARKGMSKYVVLQSLGFFLKHVVLSVLTVGLTVTFWISGFLPDTGLINMFLMANYFVLFVAVMWYAYTRTSFVKGLFTIYDSYLFRMSKEFILKVKRNHRSFFGSDLVSDIEIRGYDYGTIKEVDNNLISAWKNKSKLQYVLECLGRIELSLARHDLKFIMQKISFWKTSPPDSENQFLIKMAENNLTEKKRDIMLFEKSFYEKTGESEFL